MNNGNWIDNFILYGLMALTIIGLTFGLTSEHYKEKACNLKGGIYKREICFKKEMIYE